MTRTESIDPSIPKDVDLCALAASSRMEEFEPTHVIASITYGGNAHIVFEKVIIYIL